MDDHAQRTLSDEDITTILPAGGVATTLETNPDTKDADGTDGDDADGTDGTDSGGTDSDGTDGTDSDGTDGDSSATA